MTRFLIEAVTYCALSALVLSALKLFGAFDVLWCSIALLLLVPTMIGVFIPTVIVVHDVLTTPEDRSKARLRRHHRHWGL
jgi:hypothetical protein